jgi:pyruvyltransferase
MPIVLKQFSSWANVGDRISASIVEHVAGQPVITMPRERCSRPNLVGIGSIMSWSDDKSMLWGCGALDPSHPLQAPDRVLAVRGKLSADLLRRNGIPCPDVYGDPAVFLPEIYGANTNVSSDIGFVPHGRDRVSDFTERCRREGFRILDVGTDPEEFVTQLTACARIISSSLHGIIIAHTFGIPAAWIALSEMHGAGVNTDFKFYDYYSSVGISQGEIRPETQASSLESIVRSCQLAPLKIDKEALRRALLPAVDELTID